MRCVIGTLKKSCDARPTDYSNRNRIYTVHSAVLTSSRTVRQIIYTVLIPRLTTPPTGVFNNTNSFFRLPRYWAKKQRDVWCLPIVRCCSPSKPESTKWPLHPTVQALRPHPSLSSLSSTSPISSTTSDSTMASASNQQTGRRV